MADYIDCLDQVKNEMVINISDIFKKLPEVVKNIEDLNLNTKYEKMIERQFKKMGLKSVDLIMEMMECF